MKAELENKLDNLLGRYWDLAYREGFAGKAYCQDETNQVLCEIKALFKSLVPDNANHRVRFYREIQEDIRAPKAIKAEQKFKKLLPRMPEDAT